MLLLRRLRTYPVLGFGVAILAVGFASVLQWLLKEKFAGAPFLTIYPAVIVATLGGGLAPGLFSAILAGASQFGLFIPSFHWVAAGAYAFDATVCVLLIVLINETMDILWMNAEREKQAKQHQFRYRQRAASSHSKSFHGHSGDCSIQHSRNGIGRGSRVA